MGPGFLPATVFGIHCLAALQKVQFLNVRFFIPAIHARHQLSNSYLLRMTFAWRMAQLRQACCCTPATDPGRKAAEGTLKLFDGDWGWALVSPAQEIIAAAL